MHSFLHVESCTKISPRLVCVFQLLTLCCACEKSPLLSLHSLSAVWCITLMAHSAGKVQQQCTRQSALTGLHCDWIVCLPWRETKTKGMGGWAWKVKPPTSTVNFRATQEDRGSHSLDFGLGKHSSRRKLFFLAKTQELWCKGMRGTVDGNASEC